MERYVEKEDTFNDSLRFEAVSRLRKELSLNETDFEEVNISPLSIGIEIEMTWRQAFPEIAKQWPMPSDLPKNSRAYADFFHAYNEKDKQLKPLLKEIKHVIPRVGLDAYWEFSFLPTKNMSVTDAEIDVLYDAGILNNDCEYSLHMTVAGIDNDRDAYAFLCGLEQSGGTSAERLSEALTSKKGAWARKGKGGIVKRHTSELIGEDSTGYEFRSLSAQSRNQLHSLLDSAASLSHLLNNDPETWKVYRSSIEQHLVAHGFELKPWMKPKEDSVHWLSYIELLESVK
jgi:hypothetical protein